MLDDREYCCPYHAPEIFFHTNNFTKAVDMWSIGCILYEMLCGKPMFGTVYDKTFEKMLEVTGSPSVSDISAINSFYNITLLQNRPPSRSHSLFALCPGASSHAVDLLQKLLHLNPNKRITAEEALAHPYVAQFHNVDEEPKCNRIIQLPFGKTTSLDEYKTKFYPDIVKKNKEIRTIAKELKVNKQNN